MYILVWRALYPVCFNLECQYKIVFHEISLEEGDFIGLVLYSNAIHSLFFSVFRLVAAPTIRRNK